MKTSVRVFAENPEVELLSKDVAEGRSRKLVVSSDCKERRVATQNRSDSRGSCGKPKKSFVVASRLDRQTVQTMTKTMNICHTALLSGCVISWNYLLCLGMRACMNCQGQRASVLGIWLQQVVHQIVQHLTPCFCTMHQDPPSANVLVL